VACRFASLATSRVDRAGDDCHLGADDEFPKIDCEGIVSTGAVRIAARTKEAAGTVATIVSLASGVRTRWERGKEDDDEGSHETHPDHECFRQWMHGYVPLRGVEQTADGVNRRRDLVRTTKTAGLKGREQKTSERRAARRGRIRPSMGAPPLGEREHERIREPDRGSG
jgi:hypothetical protein